MPGDSLFARYDFRLLLLGQTTSQFGAQISGVAIPLLAVLTLDASPLELGLVTASATLAFALIGLPAGAWLDRVHRRPVLIASDLIRAALLCSIPLAAAFDALTITQLVVVSLLSGVARVFFDIGYQSYLPSVVGKDHVLAGNSALETIRASGQIVGPGLGGWLVALIGAAHVVLIQAFTFAISAASLAAIRGRERPVEKPTSGVRLRHEVGEGLRYVGRHPVLSAMAFTSAVSNLAFAIASAVTFIFMSRTLHLSPTAIGVVVALGAVFAMVGAACTPRLARRVGSARILWLVLAATGPVGLVMPLAQPGWLVVLLFVGMAAGEFGQIVYAIGSLSLRQRVCPDQMLGRVNATMRVIIMAAFPLGALFGGVLGEVVGTRGTLWVAAAMIMLAPLPVYRALRRIRDVEDVAPAS
ncbi:MFS transporter [Phytoactinopolyspora halotolerans]|uniref:MFS transporter n=1 Tax=Phytoactinopolyspora halotolerans TaxID=1981512 RepID=UPI001C205E5F|nr:MFS transporter [Phytoactinopolyspora halotolerans]